MPERFLIAESGASKTAWKIGLGNILEEAFEGPGLSPSAHSPSSLKEALYNSLSGISNTHFDRIYFYGAGLRYAENKDLILNLLRAKFATAGIEIQDDLIAAVRSTQKQEGIVCILGTGSNACHHKNEQVLKSYGGHGYLLGDEGSGMDLGKHFFKGLLDRDFPSYILEYVEEHEGKSLGAIRTSLYLDAMPNRKLASFSRYIVAWKEEPLIADMLHDRFVIFLTQTVCRIEQYEDLALDFVGGIAKHFQDSLKGACNSLKLYPGMFVSAPIDNLFDYHANP